MMSCGVGTTISHKGSCFTSRGVRHLAGKPGKIAAASPAARKSAFQISAKGKGGGRRSNTSNRPGGQPSM